MIPKTVSVNRAKTLLIMKKRSINILGPVAQTALHFHRSLARAKGRLKPIKSGITDSAGYLVLAKPSLKLSAFGVNSRNLRNRSV